MMLVQRLFGGYVVFQCAGRVKPFRHPWFLFVGQMIQDVSLLVHLAALNRRRVTRVLLNVRIAARPFIPGIDFAGDESQA